MDFCKKSKLLKILIIDSSIQIINRLEELIVSESEYKFVIESAIDLDEAVRQINKIRPGIIILDMNLPNNGSFEILKLLKKTNFITVIIALSIHIDDQFKQQAVLAGVDYFLDKYIDFEKLPALLNAQRKPCVNK
jgi:two-component system, LytTR family, response regulator